MPEVPYKVLVVDDVEEDRFIVRRHLSRTEDVGYTFFEASTGSQAVEVLRTEQIDCIIIDYNLPDMTGVEFLANLERVHQESIALIFLTGSGNESIAVEAMKQGAQDYLTKDRISRDQLQSSVRHAIEKATLMKTLGDQQGALQQSEQRFRSSVENMLDSFCIMSAVYNEDRIIDFRIEYLNQAALNMMNMPRKILIGQILSELWPNVLESQLFEMMIQVVETNQSIALNNFAYTLPGDTIESRFFDVQLTKFEQGFTVTWRDVTERRRAEQERLYLLQQEQETRKALEEIQKRLVILLEATSMLTFERDYEISLNNIVQLAVDKMADACYVDLVNSDNVLKRVAAAHTDASKTHGLYQTAEYLSLERDLTNLFWHVFVSGEARLVTQQADIESIITLYQQDQRAYIRDTMTCDSMMLVPLISRDSTIGIISFLCFQDDNPYNLLDLEMAQELAQRIATALDNVRLYQEARQAIEVRDNFLSIASHELKNPLTVLRGQSTLMLRRAERNGLDERDIRSLEAIHTQSLRMNNLIDTLLNVSRLQSGTIEMQRESVELVSLMQQITDSLKPVFSQHYLTLSIQDQPIWIIGDPVRLEQIFTNVINNAVKYSPENPEVIITLQTIDSEAHIAIQDTGIGISQEEIPHLFKRDYRVHNEQTTGIAGMGIGLYVVNELMIMHHGSIQVTSQEGIGSTFTLIFPLEQ